LQVLVRIARSRATRASVPVVTVDLPQSNIPQVSRGLASVVADSVGISARLVTHDASAVGLVPGVLGAPGGDIQNILGRTAWTRWAVARWAVTTASGASGVQALSHDGAGHGGVGQKSGEESNEKEVHFSSDGIQSGIEL
jgi:hypothetical protein